MKRVSPSNTARRSMHRRFQPIGPILLMIAIVSSTVYFGTQRVGAAPSSRINGISATAMQQIAALLKEKQARTSTQRKISSNLLYAAKQARGEPVADGIQALDTGIAPDQGGTLEVSITTTRVSALVQQLKRRGITILDANPQFRSVRARVKLADVESIAAYAGVTFVRPTQPGITAAAARAVAARSAAQALGRPAGQREVGPAAGAVDSEGDVTHRAALARSQFGVDGSGVRVCVMSNGVDSLAQQQAAGELPAVTVLPGQAGSGDEGTAMLEIVHDLAPGAELFFATGDPAIEQFAQNLLGLHASYGCDISVDDITYESESPFQKGQATTVASNTNAGVAIQAVNTVTAQGALHFSSAGNFGNLSSGESGTWEGDFAPGESTTTPKGTATLLDFDPGAGVTSYNTLATGLDGQNLGVLWWSDPLGASSNDYDMFVLDAAGSSVVASSTDPQTGTQDPIEGVDADAMDPGNRLVVVQNTGAAARFIHLSTNGSTLAFGTAGATYGHNAAESAFSVAATPAAAAAGPAPFTSGPYPNPFSSANRVEIFSSDGPRQVFFNADGTPITAGNLLAGGGQQLLKPDATAADGVSTGLPAPSEYHPFFGTSAAAPHAGAIAALVKSSATGFTSVQIRNLLLGAAIDIEASGQDRDSGAGIIDAYAAVQAAQPPSASPSPAPSASPSPSPAPGARTFVPLVGR